MDQFRRHSLDYLKNNNINIQPKNNRNILLDHIKPHLSRNFDVFIPSAKTGEFIHDLKEIDTPLNINACEENKELFDIIKDIPDVTIYNNNFLQVSPPHNFKKYDLVLGTLPSQIVDKKTDIGYKFKHWFVNKTDIYSLYFMHSINLLKHQGIAAFIIPNSICNSPYLQLLRNKIYHSGSILKLQYLSNLYTKTTHNSLLIIFKKDKIQKDDFNYKFSNMTFYTPNTPLYKSIFNNANTLHNLRAHIQNGQATPELQRCKDHDAIPIIYHKNICEDNTLQLFDNSKQYIFSKHINSKINNTPSLLFSRIIGNKDNEHNLFFSPCSLDQYICSHSIMIISFPHLKNETALILIKNIIDSLNNPKTKVWLKHFIKDGQISNFQLKYYMPIYDITF